MSSAEPEGRQSGASVRSSLFEDVARGFPVAFGSYLLVLGFACFAAIGWTFFLERYLPEGDPLLAPGSSRPWLFFAGIGAISLLLAVGMLRGARWALWVSAGLFTIAASFVFLAARGASSSASLFSLSAAGCLLFSLLHRGVRRLPPAPLDGPYTAAMIAWSALSFHLVGTVPAFEPLLRDAGSALPGHTIALLAASRLFAGFHFAVFPLVSVVATPLLRKPTGGRREKLIWGLLILACFLVPLWSVLHPALRFLMSQSG